MTDQNLLVFGCAIFFLVISGLYVAARERFVYTNRAGVERARREEARAEATSAHSEGT